MPAVGFTVYQVLASLSQSSSGGSHEIRDGRNESWAQLRAGPCSHALRILLQAGEKRLDGDASASLTVLRAREVVIAGGEGRERSPEGGVVVDSVRDEASTGWCSQVVSV
jgi:hypothetical protein